MSIFHENYISPYEYKEIDNYSLKKENVSDITIKFLPWLSVFFDEREV